MSTATGAEQQRLLNLVRDHGIEESGARAAMVLSTLVQGTARRVLAEAQAAEQAAQSNVRAPGIQPKIGPGWRAFRVVRLVLLQGSRKVI